MANINNNTSGSNNGSATTNQGQMVSSLPGVNSGQVIVSTPLTIRENSQLDSNAKKSR